MNEAIAEIREGEQDQQNPASTQQVADNASDEQQAESQGRVDEERVSVARSCGCGTVWPGTAGASARSVTSTVLGCGSTGIVGTWTMRRLGHVHKRTSGMNPNWQGPSWTCT